MPAPFLRLGGTVGETPQTLLLVTHDGDLARRLCASFAGFHTVTAGGRSSAIVELRRHEPAVVLLDLGLPPDASGVTEGFETLREIVALTPHCKVIVVTGDDDKANAVRAVGAGAYDFYRKPVDVDTLTLMVRRAFHIHDLEAENRRLLEPASDSPLDGIAAGSSSMRQACRRLETAAPTNAATLLLGESGTGKALMARALHDLSPRANGPFVVVDCAASAGDSQLEQELFGVDRHGTGVGAQGASPGRVEAADGGTLLLDEVAALPRALQGRLLRLLVQRTVERTGGCEPIPVDVRVVCASSQDLCQAVADQRFLQDLYYRIGEITIAIPPLRERGEGCVVLARRILARASREMKRPLSGFSDDAQVAIGAYPWPGNVRELENRIRSAVMVSEGKRITAEDLDLADHGDGPAVLNLREVRQRAESRAIREALVHTNGNVSRASELLGITRPTMYDLLHKYGLSADPDGRGKVSALKPGVGYLNSSGWTP